MSNLQRAQAVPTYRNTEFQAWWALTNRCLTEAGEPEASFDEAHGCYEMGEAPQTAATALTQARS